MDRQHHLSSSPSSLAGSKLRRQLGATLRESVSAPVSQFAVRQLRAMGWRPGTGLGKKRNGRTTHIRVTQRQDSAGLGSEKVAAAAAHADEWWKDSLGDTLAKLGGGGRKGTTNREKRTFTDDELFAATGGARFGMRAGRTRNLAKWRRAESNASSASARATSAAAATGSSGTKESGNYGSKDTTTSTHRGNQDSSGISDDHGDGKKVDPKRKDMVDEKKVSKKDKKSKKRSNETEDERKERKRLKKEKKKRRKEATSSSDE